MPPNFYPFVCNWEFYATFARDFLFFSVYSELKIMLFNSITFAVFLPVVFLLYWFIFNRNLRLQNLFILVASYVFYGWWDWRFLLLIAFTSLCSWGSGLLIQSVSNKQLTPPPPQNLLKQY
jgi:hypothetical protein